MWRSREPMRYEISVIIVWWAWINAVYQRFWRRNLVRCQNCVLIKYTNIRSVDFNIVTEELVRISSVILKHCEAKVNFEFHFELIIRLNKQTPPRKDTAKQLSFAWPHFGRFIHRQIQELELPFTLFLH